MNMNEKLNLLAEVMDTEEKLTPEMELNDIDEWDSITGLTFIAMLDETFEKTVQGKQLRQCKTVQDLLDLMV